MLARRLLAVAALVLLAAPVRAHDWNDKNIAWKSFDDGLAEAKKDKKPICLIVYTEWCPHCGNYSKVFADPKIVEKEGVETEVEGCLSLPGINDKVDRPLRVKVKAQDLEGKPIELEADDWLARALCHEIDHLDGILFVDHLRGLRKERVKRQLRRMAESEVAV